VGLAVSATAALFCFLACLLKARQLEGQKGHGPRGGGSIVGGGMSTALAPSLLRDAAEASRAQPSAPAAAAKASTFQLLVEGRIIPLQPGLRLELGRLPGLAHAKGIMIGVTTHPKDPSVMGLQNLGTQPWTAVHEGSSKQIDPQRNIRVSHGTLIAFGPVQGSIQEISPSP
jgi:hypothetical protein